MTKEDAVFLLKRKAEEKGTLPTRADFSPEDVVHIKALLGPWPRALEAAGLKEPKADTRHARTVEQRRRRKIAARPQSPGQKERNGPL